MKYVSESLFQKLYFKKHIPQVMKACFRNFILKILSYSEKMSSGMYFINLRKHFFWKI